MAPFAAEVAGRSAYLFPVSTAQKRYGILSTPKLQGQQFAPEDVEMLSALASHVAVALECALARDTAELYHREVVKQRDRLSLLLEINNHIVNKLEAEELFQAVAGSMRKHLGNDLTSLWLFNKQSGSLERRFLDFPTGKGFVDKVVVGRAHEAMERMVAPPDATVLLAVSEQIYLRPSARRPEPNPSSRPSWCH